MTHRISALAWKGKPIVDIVEFCREKKINLLRIRKTTKTKVPKFSKSVHSEMYFWQSTCNCSCCGGCEEGYWDYRGPMKVKTTTEEYEIPEVFYGNLRYNDKEEGVTEEVVERRIP